MQNKKFSHHIKVIDLGSAPYQRLLESSKETFAIDAGFVTLSPGESVGPHSTKNFEEVIVFLEGSGVAKVEGKEPLPVDARKVIYIPPLRRHDILNTGSDPLRYIYIVTEAKEKKDG